ncbi:hypothetical protein LOZ12_006522 [Ophidiomyces ophidiicola]|uniref:uncharacterized protein n=1 Tax=Ophidiomyces ophidiicola TaxID=1387563 RepID=UPI0020C31B0C|nr:uncharacterized protein LOZ57_006496 [Ophidiomyces ophidiicola]KAI1905683.1 hypothetical protein LOZ64_006713 [Ophidiomyces ophidiicola]KAI1906771.1 hypothetical protein LOZ61_006485 [Ophidiomyces ophidiicola]KAI1919574.1 hypothetical protein LOZ60_006818 [Ophidiomyces ophidiicola]KAI1933293.1 hypothetical protein LOZ62_006523 [Ophidiomyces ophidiicola]KAI1937864.1 hypothetical protein LOZ57_006496 [Ophidiomyces ophidiicola]
MTDGLYHLVDPTQAHSKSHSQKPKPTVADSWEDESVSSDSSDTENMLDSSSHRQTGTKGHSTPPLIVPSLAPNKLSSENPQKSDSPHRRPEKQTAVASRIITSALGLRAKRTAEQKAYDRAILENAKKKREHDREHTRQKQEEEHKAKQAVWES